MKRFLKSILPQKAQTTYSNYKNYGLINPTIREIYIIKSFKFFQAKGCLFIHIPKTAGISFYEGLFNRDSFGHFTIEEYTQLFGKRKLDRLYKCCIARDPYERALSAYLYLIKGGRGKEIDLLYQEKLSEYHDFNDFVKNGLSKGLAEDIEHFVPQTDMITDHRGKIAVDYLGRYEDFQRSYDHISLKVTGQINKLPVKNKNNSKKSISAYSVESETLTLLSAYYKRDFDLLGYQNVQYETPGIGSYS